MGIYHSLTANRLTTDHGRRHVAGRLSHVQNAAWFCFVLMACLFVLNSCGVATTTGTVSPAPTRLSTTTPDVGKVAHLRQIHMFNVSTGWAMTTGDPVNGNRRVLHTTTGVAYWQDVTPAIGNQSSLIGGSEFFDALTAWVVVGGAPTFVYRTHDGGQSWQQTQLLDQGPGNGQFSFLNARVGWLMLVKGAATGNVAVDILRTSDGGASWQLITVTSFNTASPPALPFEGVKSGISFINETTGWVTSFTNRENFAWLYVTHDGGVTWQHQDIPLPTQSVQITTMPPSFLSATDGVLPAIIPSLAGETITLYVTHNGGVSWLPTSPVHTGWGLVALADALHAWIVNDSDDAKSNQYVHSVVYSTSDGGWHWTKHIVKFSAKTTMIDFVSPTQGWAIDEGQSLYQTADGGQTWARVMPTIS